MKKRTVIVVGVSVFASVAHADLLIDDFDTGRWDHTMGGFEFYATDTVTGLDTQHTLFGMRTASVDVDENFFNLPINVTSGSGSFSVTPQGLLTKWAMRSRYDTEGPGVDMSAGDQIKIDMTIGQPGSAVVVVGAIDAANRQKIGGGTLGQTGYLLVGKNQFGTFDWSHVKTFLVETGSDNGQRRTIAIENVSLVPEPTSLAGFSLLAAIGGWRRCRRRR
jgi:hypothetical protein